MPSRPLAAVYALSGASCGSNPAATGGGGGPTGTVPATGELRPVPGVWLIAPYVDSDERRWKGLMELNYDPGSTAQYTGVIHWKSDDGEDMEKNGAVPHHLLWLSPGQLPQGRDTQLSKAIENLQSDVQAWRERPQPKLRKSTERP